MISKKRKNEAGSNRKSKPEDKVLFSCCRQNFLAEHREALIINCRQNAINWDAVYQTALFHGVAPLVYSSLRQVPSIDINLPPHILGLFKHALMRNMFHKERQAQNIANAVTFFVDNSIKVMLIKGAALDLLVYGQPYYVTAQDADLVLKVKRAQISEAQFITIMQSIARGIEYDYFEHHDVMMNGVLPVDFEQIWRDATQIEFRGQPLWVMAPEDMLISVCINSCRKRFFRLKALCDIAETINTYDLNWPEVVRRARAYDCHNIVYTALWVTRMTLGCSVTEELLDNFEVNPIRAKIIRYLTRRMSLDAFSSLYSGKNLLGRKVDWPLVLPYATFRWYQVWRRVAFVFASRGEAL